MCSSIRSRVLAMGGHGHVGGVVSRLLHDEHGVSVPSGREAERGGGTALRREGRKHDAWRSLPRLVDEDHDVSAAATTGTGRARFHSTIIDRPDTQAAASMATLHVVASGC